jgi:hypothetical protein
MTNWHRRRLTEKSEDHGDRSTDDDNELPWTSSVTTDWQDGRLPDAAVTTDGQQLGPQR